MSNLGHLIKMATNKQQQKKYFLSKISIRTVKKKSFVQKGIGYQKNYIDGKKGTHKIKFRSSAHLKSK